MSREFEERFIRPIINASYPGTLAGLNLTVLRLTGSDAPFIIRGVIALGLIMFLLCSFSIFFYTLYPTKKKLWTISATCYLLGLTSSLIAVIVILVL